MDGWRLRAATGSPDGDAARRPDRYSERMPQPFRGMAGRAEPGRGGDVRPARSAARPGSFARARHRRRCAWSRRRRTAPCRGPSPRRRSGSRNRWSRSAPPTRIASPSSPSRRLCPSGTTGPTPTSSVITPVSGRFPFATSLDVRVDAAATSVSGRRLAAPHLFRFSTATPRLLHASVLASPAFRASTPAGLDISLAFDQAVRADDVLVARRGGDRRQLAPAAAALGRGEGADGARRSGGPEAVRRLDRRASNGSSDRRAPSARRCCPGPAMALP